MPAINIKKYLNIITQFQIKFQTISLIISKAPLVINSSNLLLLTFQKSSNLLLIIAKLDSNNLVMFFNKRILNNLRFLNSNYKIIIIWSKFRKEVLLYLEYLNYRVCKIIIIIHLIAAKSIIFHRLLNQLPVSWILQGNNNIFLNKLDKIQIISLISALIHNKNLFQINKCNIAYQ